MAHNGFSTKKQISDGSGADKGSASFIPRLVSSVVRLGSSVPMWVITVGFTALGMVFFVNADAFASMVVLDVETAPVHDPALIAPSTSHAIFSSQEATREAARNLFAWVGGLAVFAGTMSLMLQMRRHAFDPRG